MPYRLRKKFGPSACNFIEEIIDGMQDLVRVINKDDTVVFVNKAMTDVMGKNIIGQKCYELLGRTSSCQNCVSKMDMSKWSQCKEEVINGHTYSITNSPLRSEENGKVEARIEVLHDITDLKRMSMELEKQNNKLLEDLTIAKRLQCNLLPKTNFTCENLDFSYIYRPCETLGGDFLDIFEIDEDHIGVYIADVSGHGVSASMLTMFLRAALDKTCLSPSKVLISLNESFNKNGFDDELYISVFYGIINIENRTITYSNAGLNVCPVLYSKNSFQILRAPGIPISTWIENPAYTEVLIGFKPNDRLFLYTDGIIEIRNKDNEQFGEDRIVDILTHSELPSYKTLSNVVDSAISFSDSRKDLVDDITVALLDFK